MSDDGKNRGSLIGWLTMVSVMVGTSVATLWLLGVPLK
jgi:hypothetical protein